MGFARVVGFAAGVGALLTIGAALASSPSAQAPVDLAQAAPPAPPPPAPPPPAPPPAVQQPGDPFGEEVMLTEKTLLTIKGTANWDSAFETLIDSFKSLKAYLDRQGLKASGPAMTIYTSTDDTGFQFQAAFPIAETPKDPPQGDMTVAKSPTGKALKFVHRGSYDAMETTYDAITNYLDDKKLEAQDLFIEEYVTDPLTTPEDKLVVNVFVPLK
jgi:effector-binding domain-containing protein